jgi:hypothetical protein
MFRDGQAPRRGSAFWEVVLAKAAEAIDIAAILASVPRRIHAGRCRQPPPKKF